MGGTGKNRYSANTYPLFLGTATTDTNWLGVLSGRYNSVNGGLIDRGSEGSWWSSTGSYGTGAYLLSLTSKNDYVYPAQGYLKHVGIAVRCVL